MSTSEPRSGTQMRWREEEDNILRANVEQYAELGCATDWSRVAEKLTRRTNKDCRKRWVNHACGGLKKGPWEADEDMYLREAVAQHGQKWTLIASEVGSRSADQCAKRWQHNLDPRLDRQRWTPKEDELLLESVDRYGREWRKIQQKHYSTRSANDLKNRFTILSKKITSRASSISGLGPGHPSSSSPTVVGVQNQEGASPGTDPGTTSRFNSSLSSEEGMDGVYNPRDLYVDMSGIMQPTTNVQQQQEQQMRPQEQTATLLPLSHDGQSMTVDDLDHPAPSGPSGFSWTTCTTPSSGTGSRPVTNDDFLNAMLSNDLATMSHHPNHHSQVDAGDSNGLSSSSSHVGNSNTGALVFDFETINPVPEGVKNGQLLSLLAHKASRLENCSPGGTVSLQTEGCDREVLNYLVDVLLPIRCLVKIEINM